MNHVQLHRCSKAEEDIDGGLLKFETSFACIKLVFQSGTYVVHVLYTYTYTYIYVRRG